MAIQGHRAGDLVGGEIALAHVDMNAGADAGQLHIAVAGGDVGRSLESFDGDIAASGGDVGGSAFGQLDGQVGAPVGPSLDLHQNAAPVDRDLRIEGRKGVVRVAV